MATLGQKLKAKISLAGLRRQPTQAQIYPSAPAHDPKDRNPTKKRSITASLRSLFTGHSVHSTASTTSSVDVQPDPIVLEVVEPTPIDHPAETASIPTAAAAEAGAAERHTTPETAAAEGAATATSPSIPQPEASATIIPILTKAPTTRALSPGSEKVYPQSSGKFIEETIVRSQPQEAHPYPPPSENHSSADVSSPSLKKKQSTMGAGDSGSPLKRKATNESVKAVRFRTKDKVAAAWTALKTRIKEEKRELWFARKVAAVKTAV